MDRSDLPTPKIGDLAALPSVAVDDDGVVTLTDGQGHTVRMCTHARTLRTRDSYGRFSTTCDRCEAWAFSYDGPPGLPPWVFPPEGD